MIRVRVRGCSEFPVLLSRGLEPFISSVVIGVPSLADFIVRDEHNRYAFDVKT